MAGTFFWNECKKTLEKDLELDDYSTWIEPLNLKENEGISPKSYSVIAPNNFILNWVEDNYGKIIKERLLAITSKNVHLLAGNINASQFFNTVFPQEVLAADIRYFTCDDHLTGFTTTNLEY